MRWLPSIRSFAFTRGSREGRSEREEREDSRILGFICGRDILVFDDTCWRQHLRFLSILVACTLPNQARVNTDAVEQQDLVLTSGAAAQVLDKVTAVKLEGRPARDETESQREMILELWPGFVDCFVTRRCRRCPKDQRRRTLGALQWRRSPVGLVGR